ncbi:hypothetical protein BDZ89DRAFT_1059417 [Hymenopellis radicata]|nr:hypothetical protein BDZ89DRAFT_1059417 [Hymenopellis radicata]
MSGKPDATVVLKQHWRTYSPFVDKLTKLLDDLGDTPGSAEWKRAEEVFRSLRKDSGHLIMRSCNNLEIVVLHFG